MSKIFDTSERLRQIEQEATFSALVLNSDGSRAGGIRIKTLSLLT